MIVEVIQRLSVSQRATLKFDKERFNFKKLSDVEIIEPYQVKTFKYVCSFGNLGGGGGGGGGCGLRESTKENMKASPTGSLSYYKLKIINYCLMKSVQIYLIKGVRLNCSGCRIQVKQMEII
jgi:hypothetical protein